MLLVLERAIVFGMRDLGYTLLLCAESEVQVETSYNEST